jgi:hypothetical protein
MTENKAKLEFDLNNLTPSNYSNLHSEYHAKLEEMIGEALKKALDSHSIISEDERIKVILNQRVQMHQKVGHPMEKLYMLDGQIPLVEVKPLDQLRIDEPKFGVVVIYWTNG